MAYGIELQNELGETITEYSSVLYEKIGGKQTITPPTIGYDPFWKRHYFAAYASRLYPTLTPYFQQVATKTRWLASGTLSNGSDFYQAWIGDDQFGMNDIPFVRPKSNGLWAMLGSRLRRVSGGNREMQWMVGSYPDTNLLFKVASTDLPSNPPGNYGMQIRKKNGDVAFDSRVKQISIAGHFYVPQADIKDVLDNNAVKTYTIQNNVANAYISMPNWTSFAFTGSGGSYVPRIRQTADNKFTVDRFTVAGLRPSGYPTPDFSAYFHDATVLVAQNI